ncbi:ABC transporter permease subunit [Paenibacillus sp. SCIV0701]|uniref:ABC transporter permease subunit n=2 Tax=Paenibacillus soyae TaxID=2969249 RepID=A0A9X2MSV8_9BACL|nr:ABC transporter permease subunit [Paenibacillus soyae]
MKRGWRLYALIALPLFYLLLFKYVPMYGIVIAFKNYTASTGILGSEWVGLEHFERFFRSYEFGRILSNTLILSLYSLAAGFPFPILLALSLNDVKNRLFKNTVQMVSYAPYFISIVVMVGIILEMLEPRHGLVNNLIRLFGFEAVGFMNDPSYFKSIFVWSGIWQTVGFNCIIYMAALASVDPVLHEAAVVDGASKLRRMWHIDLPGIMPVAVILLILNTGTILDSGFEKVLLMQNPLNLSTSEVIDSYVYKVAFTSQVVNYSYSTAIGLFKSIIGLILLVAVNKIARRAGQSSLW